MEDKKPDDNLNSKPLRTYQSDVEEILKEGEGSFAKIAIAENDKRVREGIGFGVAEEETPTHLKLIVWISISLIIIGIGLLSTLYFFRETATLPIPTSDLKPLITANSEKNLNIAGLSRGQIIKILTKERDESTAKLSSMVAIKLIDGEGELAKPITTEEFVNKLESGAPSELIRSLDGNFMFGIHALSKNQPFIIFKTVYYQNAFAGMLSWEKSLKDDLGPIFIYPEPISVPTTSEQVLNNNLIFEDIVIKNRDARALRGADGKIIFLYSFPGKDTIIITTNADTLEQVTARLLAKKLVQ